ncbi:hypothetical protein ACA910_007718 [Epithemia clementina (nom. ined.)]
MRENFLSRLGTNKKDENVDFDLSRTQRFDAGVISIPSTRCDANEMTETNRAKFLILTAISLLLLGIGFASLGALRHG